MSIEYIKIPLPMDVLQEVLKSKGAELFIDYTASKPLQNIGFLSYISNLSIKARIDIYSIETEELSDLLYHYMTTKQLVVCEELATLHMMMILKFIELENIDTIFNIDIDESFFEDFISKHKELLTREFIFLSSLIGYSIKLYDLSEDRPHDYGMYEGTITDALWVGTNITNLFQIPSFMELFFSKEGIKYPLFYFESQFENMIFNGRELLYYFHDRIDGKNWLLGAVHQYQGIIAESIETVKHSMLDGLGDGTEDADPHAMPNIPDMSVEELLALPTVELPMDASDSLGIEDSDENRSE